MGEVELAELISPHVTKLRVNPAQRGKSQFCFFACVRVFIAASDAEPNSFFRVCTNNMTFTAMKHNSVIINMCFMHHFFPMSFLTAEHFTDTLNTS